MKTSILCLALAFSLLACSKEVPPKVTQERPALTQIVGGLAGEDSHLYSGEVRARHETTLGFRLGGKITQRMVDAGAVVKAGQVLARLDGADAGLQASAADAQYQLAEAELKRYRVLLSKNFVSQSAFDIKEAALKSLSAQYGLARNQSTYTTLVADHDGVVMAMLAEVGQVVAAGQPVLRLAQNGGREIAIAIPERQYADFKVGMKAEVSLWSEGQEVVSRGAYLRELTPAADAASRTYAARIAVEDATLPLGMTAQVRFVGMQEDKSELLVPMSAIFQQGDKSALWVVAADRSVSLRPVQVASYRDEGAVIASGISAGERIVTHGVHKLIVGEKIRVVEAGSAQ